MNTGTAFDQNGCTSDAVLGRVAGFMFGSRAVATAKSSLPNRRLELLWAWASALVLILCWDVALRLDQSAPPPGMHARKLAELHHAAQLVHLVKYQ